MNCDFGKVKFFGKHPSFPILVKKYVKLYKRQKSSNLLWKRIQHFRCKSLDFYIHRPHNFTYFSCSCGPSESEGLHVRAPLFLSRESVPGRRKHRVVALDFSRAYECPTTSPPYTGTRREKITTITSGFPERAARETSPLARSAATACSFSPAGPARSSARRDGIISVGPSAEQPAG